MKAHYLFALAPIIAVAFAASNETLDSKLNGWYPCSDFTFSDQGSSTGPNAECAMYNAPLCYPGVCDSQGAEVSIVDIFVKRMPATNGDPESAPNVWFLEGGPGFASSNMEFMMVDLHAQLDGTANVYTMDHRGTGRSTLLDCVAAQVLTTGSPFGDQILPEEVPACAKALHHKYGDLASFSVTSAATDMTTFISKYTNGASTTVVGTSYGTVWAERIMLLNPPEVTGYVLDGVTTTGGALEFRYLSTWDTDFGEVGDHFLDLCANDSATNAHFASKTLEIMLKDVLDRFESDPNSTCAAIIGKVVKMEPDLRDLSPSMTLRRALGSLLGDSKLRAFIPPVVYRLDRCAPKDIDVLTRFVKSLNWRLTLKFQDQVFFSQVLYYLIAFSELWEKPTMSKAESIAQFKNVSISDGGNYWMIPLYCAASKEKSVACDEFNFGNYDGDGMIYDRDQYWNMSTSIPSQASVLIFSGKLDPQTPHKFAEYLLEALNGNKKELVTFEYTPHGALGWSALDEQDGSKGTCAMKILASYVNNDGDLTRLNKSCVGEMPPFNLTLPTTHLHSYLRTDDAYDGDFNASLA